MFKALLTTVVALVALAACAGQPADNRTALARTEIAATAAYKETTTLVNAGIIKAGTRTAIVIADAQLALAAAIRVWRTDPENPRYAEAAMAALPSLLSLIANVKAGKVAQAPPPIPAFHRHAYA